jgi:hypothetical protein
MSTLDKLVLDLLEWLHARERTYEEVMDAWRTSCPRFPVWEEANDRGLIAKANREGGVMVMLTRSGHAQVEQWRRPLNRGMSSREGFAKQ